MKFIFIVILSLFSILPLFRSGFFPMHDGVHPQRINQMEKALISGQIPPRWSPDLGFGYGWPQFSFYSPLPYYFGALINFLSQDVLISTKIAFGLCMVLSAIFMFLLVKELFGTAAGLVAGIFYLYSPYHSLDLYVRGALGELWGMMFIPLVLFFMVKSFKEKKAKWIIGGGFAYAGLILSHNITALIFTIFILLILIIFLLSRLFFRKPVYILNSAFYILILGLLISCYFWLPAVLESKYTNVEAMKGGQFGYRNHFIAFRQIWDSPWDFGASAGIFSGLSFMVGKLHLILTGLCLILGIYNWKKNKNLLLFIGASVLFLLLSVLMTNHRSDFIWRNLSFLSFFQFPWRFLIFVLFLSSFLSGVFIYLFPQKFRFVIMTGLIIGVILLNKQYFKPKKFINVGQNYYLTGTNLTDWATAASFEYIPVWRPITSVPAPKEKIVLNNGSYKIKNLKVGLYQFTVDLEKNSEIIVNNNYFPGWRVYIDNQEVTINFKKNGLIRFLCPKGQHEIIVRFEETRLRFIADAISAGSLFILLSFFMLKLINE